MKKYIQNIMLFLLPALVLASCTEDEGTEPGGDSNPVVTVYQYTASLPLNADNDATFLIAANNKVESAYYLAESTDDYDTRVASLGEDGYKEYVVENGTKLDSISGVSEQSLNITDMQGDYTITFVAKDGNTLTSNTQTFKGLIWTDVANGTYTFSLSRYFPATTTTLQKCENEDGLYRFKDLFGTGYHMKFNIASDAQEDEYGTFYYISVSQQATSLSFGSYGTIYVRDVATWQNNSGYIVNNKYYPGDNYVQIWMEYYVSAGYLTYDLDTFVAE
jgi:hypothetical protein